MSFRLTWTCTSEQYNDRDLKGRVGAAVAAHGLTVTEFWGGTSTEGPEPRSDNGLEFDGNDPEVVERLRVALADLTGSDVVLSPWWRCEECGNAITQDGTIGPDHDEECFYHDATLTMCEDLCGLHVDHDGRCRER